MFEKIITYSKILGVHAEARLRTLLQLFRVLTVLSVGTHEVPSQKRSKEYLFLATAPAATNAVGMTLFELGKACAHDVVFLCETVLPDVQMALWIANKKNEKLAELVNPQKRGFKRSRANPETKNAAIAAAAHRIATTAVEAVIQVARKREAATRKMSANVAAAAVATIVAEARKRDQAAAMAEAEKTKLVITMNSEAARRRSAVQKRTEETREMWKREKTDTRKAKEAARLSELQQRSDEAQRVEKERRKAERKARKTMSVTMPAHTKTKSVFDSNTLVPPIPKPVVNSNAPVSTAVSTQAVVHASVRHVVGSDPVDSKPAKHKSPTHGSTRLLPDKRSFSAAVTLQSAWRRQMAVQRRLLAQFQKTAAAKKAPTTKQAERIHDLDAKTNKAPMRSAKPMCKFQPCRRPGCFYRHLDGQHQPDRAKFSTVRAKHTVHASARTSADPNECSICLEPVTASDIGALPCGHAGHHKCMVVAVNATSACPTCRAPCSEGAVIKIRV